MKIFQYVKPLLNQSDYNIVNLEGAITSTKFPLLIDKTFHFRMPPRMADILVNAKIHAVTLGNNHSMDYSYMGLFETQALLHARNIKYTGAGANTAEASIPAILQTRYGSVCLLSFSQVYPAEAWAKPHRPGALHVTFTHVSELIRRCTQKYTFTIPIFHWGEENQSEPKDYQVKLAKLAIDSGASLVIGHHPHVIQNVETYKNKLIVYSLGNFAFSSRPMVNQQQGMAAKVFLGEGKQITKVELIPLNVHNRQVFYRPKFFALGNPEGDITTFITDKRSCHPLQKQFNWICEFSGGWRSPTTRAAQKPKG